MTTPRVKLDDDQFKAIARAIADPRRFAILEQIAASSALPCSALVHSEPITPATISHHLKELGEAGLISAERNGRTMTLTFIRSVWKAYQARLADL